MKTLLINNFSPFVSNIVKVLNDLNCDWTIYDGSDLSSFDPNFLSLLQKFDSVILSGRKQNSPMINKINSGIVKGCILLDKPLLGICYGGQILALTLGCPLKKMEKIQDTIKIDILKSSEVIT